MTAAWLLFLNAIMFSVSENQYFGWNGRAHSDAELICDGITAILFAFALFAFGIARKK